MEHTDLGKRVRREQVTLLYRQLPTSIAGTLIGTSVLVVAILPPSSQLVLVVWLAIVIANQVRRWLLYRRFVKQGIRDDNVDRWERYWVFGSGFSGLLWGVTPFLFLPTDNPGEQLVLTVLVFGVATGAIPLISSHAATAYAFTIPALLPFVIQNAFVSSRYSYLLMVIESTVMLAILSFGRNYSRTIIKSLMNRFENEALAETLRHRNTELRKANEAIEGASKAKSQFFAAASHDLRQPLQALGLFANALNEKVRDPGVAHLVSSVRASVTALDSLFNELLDLSKIDAGAVHLNLVHFTPNPILDRLRRDFEPEAAAKNLRLSVRQCRSLLYSDPVLLERILRNLLSNAVRYTEGGGVLLGCRCRGSRVLFEVWDTGIGIPDEQRQKIFEEFYQIGNPERSNKRGLGLGLSIVKRLSGLLGEEVTLSTRQGSGTVFRFSIPQGSPAGLEQPEHLPSAVQSDIAGSTVVVIDDDRAILDGMTWLLTDWGAQVIASPHGSDVVDKLYAMCTLPDVVIADYQLAEGRNGARVLQDIRNELDPEIPAILLTGSTTPECVEEANRYGFDLLLKPAEPATLRSMIAARLRKRRLAPDPVRDPGEKSA